MAGNTILFVIMGICGVFMALPLVMILNNALKPLDELFRYPPQIFVRNPSLDNFSDLYVLMSSSWVPFTRYVLNTLIITGLGTVGHVLFASLATYPLAKHDFGKEIFILDGRIIIDVFLQCHCHPELYDHFLAGDQQYIFSSHFTGICIWTWALPDEAVHGADPGFADRIGKT